MLDTLKIGQSVRFRRSSPLVLRVVGRKAVGTVTRLYNKRISRKFFEDGSAAVELTFPGTYWERGVVVPASSLKAITDETPKGGR
jgi:hypothetical protein